MPHRTARDVDRQIALAREWDELVAQIRQLDGFEDFLRPPRLEGLLSAAEGGPVVIVNVSRLRCDALIVRTGGIQAVELTGLTQDSVAEHVDAYLNAVGASEGAARDLRRERGALLEPQLKRCLRWMWDAFACTILEHLGYTEPPKDGVWPRVWWCPTGALTLLPIHAAGYHGTPGAAVLDRVISSYTPTLRALLQARGDTHTVERMLFVGLAETPGQPSLPNVEHEERALRRLLRSGAHKFLNGPQATRAAVLDELRAHGWVHFACHGYQNLQEPSQGGLHMHDGVITVTEFSKGQHRGELAYLSGCKTAVGGVKLPDEAITLAAAMHYTGYRHVIATLWSVRDEQAAQVAENVYARLVQNGSLNATNAAEALHHAVRALRAEHPDEPSIWTPFAHTGP